MVPSDCFSAPSLPARQIEPVAASLLRRSLYPQRLQGLARMQQGAQGDTPQMDTAEQIYISSLALIKVNGELV